MSSEPVTTRRCNECGEWYDARFPACFCGAEKPEHNNALVKAAHESALHSATTRQLAAAGAEARATSMVSSRALDGRRGTQGIYPGARGLEQSIRQKLHDVGMLA